MVSSQILYYEFNKKIKLVIPQILDGLCDVWNISFEFKDMIYVIVVLLLTNSNMNPLKFR